MILKNHIAHRLLTEDSIIAEIIESVCPDDVKQMTDGTFVYTNKPVYEFFNRYKQKAYYITDTVIKQFENLKIKKIITDDVEHYNWTFFKKLPDQKITFILPGNSVLRFVVTENLLNICLFKSEKLDGHHDNVTCIMFAVDRFTGEEYEYCDSDDIKSIQKYVYSLLCFFYLTDNETIEIEPGQKHESKKSGMFINSLDDIPVTIVNSRWNITVIRTEGFTVSGYLATRWTGIGRTIPKLIFVSPFEKNGYIRKAKSLSNV